MADAGSPRADALQDLTVEPLTFGVPAGQPSRKALSVSTGAGTSMTAKLIWAMLDKQDASANTLSEGVLIELDKLLDTGSPA